MSSFHQAPSQANTKENRTLSRNFHRWKSWEKAGGTVLKASLGHSPNRPTCAGHFTVRFLGTANIVRQTYKEQTERDIRVLVLADIRAIVSLGNHGTLRRFGPVSIGDVVP